MVLRAKGKRPKLKRPPKYGNKKILADGIRFDSEKEWLRYEQLTLALKTGLIKNLEVHPRFEIAVNSQKVCTYVADFAYEVLACSGKVVEDTKGVRTKDYIIKKKLMKAVHGVEIREI